MNFPLVASRCIVISCTFRMSCTETRKWVMRESALHQECRQVRFDYTTSPWRWITYKSSDERWTRCAWMQLNTNAPCKAPYRIASLEWKFREIEGLCRRTGLVVQNHSFRPDMLFFNLPNSTIDSDSLKIPIYSNHWSIIEYFKLSAQLW